MPTVIRDFAFFWREARYQSDNPQLLECLGHLLLCNFAEVNPYQSDMMTDRVGGSACNAMKEKKFPG